MICVSEWVRQEFSPPSDVRQASKANTNANDNAPKRSKAALVLSQNLAEKKIDNDVAANQLAKRHEQRSCSTGSYAGEFKVASDCYTHSVTAQQTGAGHERDNRQQQARQNGTQLSQICYDFHIWLPSILLGFRRLLPLIR